MIWEAGCQCIMQNQLENRAYAGFLVRLIAFAIDSLIAACVVSTIKSPFTMASAAGVEWFDANFLFHYSFLDVLDYVGVAAYFVLLTYFNHTTLGKMIMGLEVVSSDEDWTLVNVIYRETIGRFFSSLMCIGYFAIIATAKKQGFHDMLCNTYVVYKNLVPRVEPVMAVAAPVATTTVSSTILDDDIIEGLDEDVPTTEKAIEEPVTMVEESVAEGAKPATGEYVAPVYYTMPEKKETE